MKLLQFYKLQRRQMQIRAYVGQFEKVIELFYNLIFTDAFTLMMDDNRAREKGMSMISYRMSMMESICDEATCMSSISPNVCRRACNHQSVALIGTCDEEKRYGSWTLISEVTFSCFLGNGK